MFFKSKCCKKRQIVAHSQKETCLKCSQVEGKRVFWSFFNSSKQKDHFLLQNLTALSLFPTHLTHFGPAWWLSKESACNAGAAGDDSLIPGSGRSPGEGNGNALQYSCLENPMDSRPWWATVHRVAKSWTQLSNFTFTFRYVFKKPHQH